MQPHRNFAVVEAAVLFAASIDKTPALLHWPQILKSVSVREREHRCVALV